MQPGGGLEGRQHVLASEGQWEWASEKGGFFFKKNYSSPVSDKKEE